MTSAASVLVCALSLLGRSEASFPRIELVETPPPYVSVNAEGFVERQGKIIYLVTGTPTFRAIRNAQNECGLFRDLRKIASILIHEEWHVLNGSDEEGAYLAQITALIRLGEEIHSPLVGSVRKSMQAVLKAREARLLAAR